jgi:hypothetical protein
MALDPVTEFRERFGSRPGVLEVNQASHNDTPALPGAPSLVAIEVLVEAGFDPASLPAGYMGLEVLLRDTDDQIAFAKGPLVG